jgi:endo-1,4-beta-xylanase
MWPPRPGSPHAKSRFLPAMLLAGLLLIGTSSLGDSARGAALPQSSRPSAGDHVSLIKLRRAGRFELTVRTKACEGHDLRVAVDHRIRLRITIDGPYVHALTPMIRTSPSLLEVSSPRCARGVEIVSVKHRGAEHRSQAGPPGAASAGNESPGSELSSASGAADSTPAPAVEASPGARTITIGTAVNEPSLAGSDPRYRATLLANFQGVTPENEMKWETTEPEQGVFNFAPADYIVNFATAHGMTVHGHNLVWNSQLPAWLTSRSWSRPELEAILHQHIEAVVSHFRNDVHEWDVVNEPLNNDGTLEADIFSEVIGPEYIALALRWAHEADPTAALFINDYNIDWPGPKQAAMLALAARLKAEGVPLDGIGMEEHLSLTWSPTASQVQAAMLSFQALGLKVEVTEMDVGTAGVTGTSEQKEAAQATVFGEVAHACRVVPACTRFSVWGVSDAVSWLGVNEAGLPFNANYEAKPAWRAIQSNLENP